MQYMCLIYTPEREEAEMPKEQMDVVMQEYNNFTQMIRERGVMVAGEALHPTSAATTVRVRDGKTITTDGPFAETKEQLGGFYIIEAKDIDEAVEMGSKIPGAKHGSIEVRPLVIFN